jgi:vitamin B12 transporter
VRLAGYGTLDLRAEWALSTDLKLALKLNNVGDKAYQTSLGYNQPGREGYVSVRYAFR